jgi:hypothetical protein
VTKIGHREAILAELPKIESARTSSAPLSGVSAVEPMSRRFGGVPGLRDPALRNALALLSTDKNE